MAETNRLSVGGNSSAMRVHRTWSRGMATASLLVILSATSPLSAGIAVPAYSSNPGAAYTLYLNFGGFSFTGNWGSTGKTPGVVPAYTVDSDATAFSATELSYLRDVWSRTAEKYVGMSVNVTTIDPAVAAGQASTDTARQNYYDNTPRMMHTVVGGTSAWYGSAGGVSYVGVAQGAYSSSTAGYHTNWVFPNSSASNIRYLSEAASHENGHALSLSHQGDYNGTTLVNEYSRNGNPNGGYSGDGSYAPTMGVAYYTQRGLWRLGTSSGANLQNDYARFGALSGMTLQDDGIGHSIQAATVLPVAGTAISPALARGFITPKTLSSPNPIGVSNYTVDYFQFFSLGTQSTMTLLAGGQRVAAGVADVGATFDGTLKIYNNLGVVVATATRAASTLSNAITINLPAGNYYAEVASIGGYTSTFDATAKYYTSGSYFLTGSGLYNRLTLTGKSLANTNLTGQNLRLANLAATNFSGANLTSASLVSATLTGANLTGTTLAGADLSSAIDFTAAQLYTTASYRQQNLPGLVLKNLNLAGWNFAGQNLAGANLTNASTSGANFNTADLRGAVGVNLADASKANTILANGAIAGLNLAAGETLIVRDHPQAITVQTAWTMDSTAAIEIRLADLSWSSTIGTSITPALGGTLAVRLEPVLDPLTLDGASFDLFDWGGPLPAEDAFATLDLATLPSGYRWDTTSLYTTGDIAVLSLPGDFNLDGYVDAADYTAWADSFGTRGTLLPTDANHDGVVDSADYTVWADNFGQSTPPPSSLSAVPEPGVMVLALTPVVSLSRRRR